MLRNKDKELALKFGIVDKENPVILDKDCCEEDFTKSEIEKENDNLKEVILQLSKQLTKSEKFIEHLEVKFDHQVRENSFLRGRVSSLEEEERVLEMIVDKIQK